MAGAVPAGSLPPTGDEGCRIKSTRMIMTTIHGNSSTTPRGTEILEFPLNRNGRRKIANRVHIVFFFVFSVSAVGIEDEEAKGKRLRALRTTSIAYGSAVLVDIGTVIFPVRLFATGKLKMMATKQVAL